jgi:hypothetical protein
MWLGGCTNIDQFAKMTGIDSTSRVRWSICDWSRQDALQKSDSIVAPLAHECEHGVLRVRALDNTAAVRHLNWAVEDLPSTSLHVLCRRVDIAWY